jgi:hypothetical protein
MSTIKREKTTLLFLRRSTSFRRCCPIRRATTMPNSRLPLDAPLHERLPTPLLQSNLCVQMCEGERTPCCFVGVLPPTNNDASWHRATFDVETPTIASPTKKSQYKQQQ